jgi:hypothetical protein
MVSIRQFLYYAGIVSVLSSVFPAMAQKQSPKSIPKSAEVADTSSKSDAEPTQKITEGQAIKVAEKFVAENGYTAVAASSNPLARESLTLTRTGSDERLLRHNTLEPGAYGIFSGCPRGKGSPPFAGWTVIFQYSKQARAKDESIDQRGVGRAVTMDEFGHDIMVQHKDIFLKAAQRKL